MAVETKCNLTSRDIPLYAASEVDSSLVHSIEETLKISAVRESPVNTPSDFCLRIDGDGLSLIGNGAVLRGDFKRSLSRLTPNNLNHELLVKAAKIRDKQGDLTAIDATAGLGEDAFLLAAAGFHVELYERNPIIAALLSDALRRASEEPALAPIVDRMQLHREDSIRMLPHLMPAPDIVTLDPMFPERKKTGLTKKKLQMLQQLEQPCSEERALLDAAIACRPRRIVIKRPLKGPYLANQKPSFTIKGKAIRYDCIAVSPKAENLS